MTTRSKTKKHVDATSTNVQENNKAEDGYVFFWKPAESFGELGQWFPSPFVLEGKSFATAEQFMMYCKATMFNDSDMAEQILYSGETSPANHKKMGRGVRNFNEKLWNELSMNIVVIGNLCKFTQNPKLLTILMDTGDKELVEASALDRIWGVGFEKKNALKYIGKWGMNKLGKALMIVRKVIAYRLAHNLDGPVTDLAELMELRKNLDVVELDATGIFA